MGYRRDETGFRLIGLTHTKPKMGQVGSGSEFIFNGNEIVTE